MKLKLAAVVLLAVGPAMAQSPPPDLRNFPSWQPGRFVPVPQAKSGLVMPDPDVGEPIKYDSALDAQINNIMRRLAATHPPMPQGLKLSLLGPAFERLAPAGMIPIGQGRLGPWGIVKRVFRQPNGNLVTLEEEDYVANQTGGFREEGAINTHVGPYRATRGMRYTPTGRTIVHVEWITAERYYMLEVLSTIDKQDETVKLMMELAHDVMPPT